MRRIARPTGNVFLDITKSNDMHFIYAFFFENGDDVHVKVGQSTRPYKRLAEIVHGSPFPVSQAVYCHIGGKDLARSFEERLRHALKDRRTRGEWYVFDKSEGRAFSAIIRITFAKCAGRELKWAPIDLDRFTTEQARAAEKYLGRKGPEAA